MSPRGSHRARYAVLRTRSWVQMGGEVPHVELSLTEDPSRLPASRKPATESSRLPQPRSAPEQPAPPGTGLERWAAVVDGAAEGSLVLDRKLVIIAASASCARMIGLGSAAAARGRRLKDAGVHLVDFTPQLDALDSAEADKIPPVMAISSGRLARGLMRVVCPESKIANTLDAIATPLWDGGTVVGSLTFFSEI